MHYLLEKVSHYSPAAQLKMLLTAHHTTTTYLAEMKQHKLPYIERGLVDVWQFEYDSRVQHAQQLRTALDELTLRSVVLPEWIPSTGTK